MIRVQLNLHDRKTQGIMVETMMPRVPVAGDIIHHEDTEYIVSTVVFYTSYRPPYVVAKVPVLI